MFQADFVFFRIRIDSINVFFNYYLMVAYRDIDSPGHDNERFWDFQNNQICLYSNQRQLTATFDCCYEEEGHSYW